MKRIGTTHNLAKRFRTYVLFLSVIASAVLIGLVGVGSAQNLLTNPSYNGNLNGWNAYAATYDGALDATGVPGSGSAHDTYDNPNAGSVGSILQCVLITSGNQYIFGGKVLVPSQELNQTYSGISLSWFSNTDCNGAGFISNAGSVSAGSDVVGSWRSLGPKSGTAPAGAKSAAVYGYFGGPSDVSHSVNFDDMFLEAAPNAAIPTMNEWGTLIFMTLAGIGSVYYLRRQSRA